MSIIGSDFIRGSNGTERACIVVFFIGVFILGLSIATSIGDECMHL